MSESNQEIARSPYQAQHGEDRWLEQYFRGRPPGVFVEVGAHDGVFLSNTYLLETLGWRGILVEPDPEKSQLCRQNRPTAQVFECACLGPSNAAEVTFHRVLETNVLSTATMTDFHAQRLREWGMSTAQTKVRARTLDSVLEESGAKSIDVLTIDVEEGELEVLRGFDLLRWHPSVVMVESNGRWRNNEVREYFTARGYAFLKAIAINDIYVPVWTLSGLTGTVDGFLYAARHKLPTLIRRDLTGAARSLARQMGLRKITRRGR